MLGGVVLGRRKLSTIPSSIPNEPVKTSHPHDAVNDVLLLNSNDILGADVVPHQSSDPVPTISKIDIPRSLVVADNHDDGDGDRVPRCNSQPFYLPNNGNSCFM